MNDRGSTQPASQPRPHPDAGAPDPAGSRPTPFLIVANAAAGTAEQEAVQAVASVLGSQAHTEVAWPRTHDALDALLHQLDGRRLVVAGGDGSLHVAVARLRALGRLDVPLGLIPLGTGNDFARSAGLPLDPTAAARTLLDGAPRPVDLLVTDRDEVVVNAAHAGLGAAASQAATGLKPMLGPLAYPLGALVAGVREHGFSLEVRVDGRVVHQGATLMVGITNGCSIGGGAQLCRMARIDDGVAEAVVVTAVGPAARIAFASALKGGTHLDRDDVAVHHGTQITVTGDAVRHVLDGELSEELDTVTYRVQPGAWRLLR